jgi:uncharacterized protein YecT (DUF1311 family)
MKTFVLATVAVLTAFVPDAQTLAETNELKPQELAERLHNECGEQWEIPGPIATCLREKEKAFGKELDQIYKKALTLAGANKPLLRETQRNWLKYQESTCKLRGQLMKPEGANIWLSTEARCLLEMTLERLEELRWMTNEHNEGGIGGKQPQ